MAINTASSTATGVVVAAVLSIAVAQAAPAVVVVVAATFFVTSEPAYMKLKNLCANMPHDERLVRHKPARHAKTSSGLCVLC